SADKRTQSRFSDLKGVLETLTARLARIETELEADDVDAELRPPARPARPGARLSRALPPSRLNLPRARTRRSNLGRARRSEPANLRRRSPPGPAPRS